MASPPNAYAKVARAIRDGELPKLDGSIPCVDCGEPAVNYDHRDYTKPLEVDPVCARCNGLRGPAKEIPAEERSGFDYMLRIRIFPEEKVLLKEAADSDDLTISEWVRKELRALARQKIEEHRSTNETPEPG